MGSPFSWFDTNAANDEQAADTADDRRVAPGKRTLTSRIPAGAAGQSAGASMPSPLLRDPGMTSAAAPGAAAPAGDPFGVHLGPDSSIADKIHEKLHGLIDDEAGALALLRADHDRRYTCRVYHATYGVYLWTDFSDNASGDILHQALALLLPCMTLLQRLETHTGRIVDDKGAIRQTILDASDAELKAAPPSEIERYIMKLPALDAYKARSRVWPQNRILNMIELLKEADGYVFDDEGPVATALLAMTPQERFELWTGHHELFAMFSTGERDKIRRMCESGPNQPASQADAISARMELATVGLGTDEDGAMAAVGAAGHARDELARVNTSIASGKRPDGKPLSDVDLARLQQRRAELGDVDTLLEPSKIKGGTLDPNSFLGSVQDDMGSDAVDQAMTVARAGTYERTKQLLLGTIELGGLNVDEESALRILREVQGDLDLKDGEDIEKLKPEDVRKRRDAAAAAIRKKLQGDKDLGPVWKALNSKETAYADNLASSADGASYEAAIYELTEAFKKVDTDEQRLLDILCGLTPADRVSLMKHNPRILDRIRAWPLADRRFVQAFDTALATGQVPAGLRLDVAFGNSMDGTDVDLANDALNRVPPEDRARFRRGYLLARRLERGEIKGALPPADQEAVDGYRGMRRWMKSELSAEQLDGAIERLLGLPTVDEMKSGGGRLDAAAVMLMRQRERLRMTAGITYPGLPPVPTTELFTTTDDAAAAAHVEFEARYNGAIADGELDETEFAVLVHLDIEFNNRFREFADTANMVSEIAGTVAAVAAAAVVIVASGGTMAAPTVAAWLSANSTLIAVSAATSALMQVAVSEAAGGSFNDLVGTDGVKQGLAGAINGALAVCGAALAEKVASMVGLSGRALTAHMARAAADATAISVPGKGFVRGALIGLIDGSLGGAVGELTMTLTDAETYKRTVWEVLARAGEAFLRGGLTGGATGAASGGLMEALQQMISARGLRGVDVVMEQGLGPRARFDFELDDPAGTMRILFGPGASDADLAEHVERVVMIRRAQALRAEAAKELATVSGHAKVEVEKLQKLIDDRLLQLQGDLTPAGRDVVQADLDLMKANLERFKKVAASGDMSPGSGVIGQPDRPSPSYPGAPELHYYRKSTDVEGGWDLCLYPDAPKGTKRYTLEKVGNKFEIADRVGTVKESIRFDDDVTPSRAFKELWDENESFREYVGMLEELGFADRKLVMDSLIDARGETHDTVRHAFKQTWQPHVLERTAGMSEAESIVELRALTAKLNSSDAGNIQEAWYQGRNKRLIPHPEMNAQDNPSLRGRDQGRRLRKPDWVDEDELIQMKSTGRGLSGEERVQIEDDLMVCRQKGVVRLEDGSPRKVRSLRLVFTDVEGARGAAKQLTEWVEAHANFTIEVFGTKGARTEIRQANLDALLKKHKVADLTALLEVL